jgi:CHAT domain-containing protein
MDLFYRYLLEEQMPPAAALRAAQNAMRREPQWQAPFYWAGFVLQGEWNRGPL